MPVSQAGRRGFESRLSAPSFNNLADPLRKFAPWLCIIRPMACRSEQDPEPTPIKHWINWAELAGGDVETFLEPGSLADLVRIVQDAEGAEKGVRAVGSGWAFEDIAYSSHVMVSLFRLNSVLDYVTDPVRGALLSLTISGGRSLVHVE